MRLALIFVLSILCTSVSYGQGPTTGMTKTSAESINQQYQKIELGEFVSKHQLPKKMIEAKHRVILRPNAIQFSAKLMQAPQAGKYSLVYEMLQLWPSTQPLPEISHSAFLQAADGKVLSVYVSKVAAAQMQQLFDDSNAQQPIGVHIYAMHIYNYAHGPRLVVIGAQANRR